MKKHPLVRIRPIELVDAEAVQRYAADATVAATTNIPHPYPENGGRQFVARAVADRKTRKRYVFAILYEGEFAGTIGINGIDTETGTASLDYGLAVAFWDKGIATAAAQQAIQFAFTRLGLSVLQSCCLKDNIASRKVLERNGFVCIEEYTHDGRVKAEFVGRAMLRFQLKKANGS